MKGLSVEARKEITKVTSRPVPARPALHLAGAAAARLHRRAAAHHRHLHRHRQPVRAVPGGDAALPEQPRRLGRHRRAEERADRPTCCWSPSWCCSCSSAPRRRWARCAASWANAAPVGPGCLARHRLLPTSSQDLHPIISDSGRRQCQALPGPHASSQAERPRADEASLSASRSAGARSTPDVIRSTALTRARLTRAATAADRATPSPGPSRARPWRVISRARRPSRRR